jgi:hypothetical protein
VVNPEKMFDVRASDEKLKAELQNFLSDGGTGRELIALIYFNQRPGIAKHTERLITLLDEVLKEDPNNETD